VASSECSYNVAAAVAVAASRLPVGLPLRNRMVSVEVEEVDLVAEDMTDAVPQAWSHMFPDYNLLTHVAVAGSMDSMCESASASAQPIDCALGGQQTGILGVLCRHVSILLHACIDRSRVQAYLHSQVAAPVLVEERFAVLRSSLYFLDAGSPVLAHSSA